MRAMCVGLAGLVAVVAAVPPVGGCGRGIPSPLARFMGAECVVIGTVSSIEDNNVAALPGPGQVQKRDYMVAVVKIDEALRGAEGNTHIRVGLLPPQNLRPGEQMCLFLRKHFEEPFYVYGSSYDYPIQKAGNTGFDAEMKQYRRWGELLRDPTAGLACDNAQDRLVTAALLVSHHRGAAARRESVDGKSHAIDATQSKRILQALAEADWNRGIDGQTYPSTLVGQLGLTPQDGWDTSRSFKDVNAMRDAFRVWVATKGASYRIQSFTRGV